MTKATGEDFCYTAVLRTGVYGVLSSVGVAVLLILAFPGLADLLRDALVAPVATKTVSLAMSVGLIAVRLFLRLSFKRTELAEEVDELTRKSRPWKTPLIDKAFTRKSEAAKGEDDR